MIWLFHRGYSLPQGVRKWLGICAGISRSPTVREYITGHGARNYLDHKLFNNSDVDVKYMQYNYEEYKQQHGNFTPYVTALDLVANCGKEGISFISTIPVDWREFLGASNPE